MEFLWIGFAFFIALIFLKLVSDNRGSGSKSPPSPPGLPILGHLHLLGKLPHQSLQKLSQRYGGLMLLKLGIHNTLVVSTAETARELLKTQDHVFSSRPRTITGENFGYGGAGMVWAAYGDHWRSVRKLCTLELLTAKRVVMFQQVRKTEMSMLLKELQSSHTNPVELTSKLLDLTFNFMTRMVMNRSYSTGSSAERELAVRFKNLIVEAFTVAGSNTLADFFPYLGWMDGQAKKISSIHKQLDEYLAKQIVEHRQQPGTNRDFLDMMLAAKDLSDTSIKALCLDMIAAGTDTAAVTVEWALAELVNNPAMVFQVQEELKEVVGENRALDEIDLPKLTFLQAIVKETLRLHPPGPLSIPHQSIQACELEGYVIPAGTHALVNVYAIARDPRWWDEPLKFDPERFLRQPDIDVRGQSFELLPFGSGRRSCPGILLGTTTVQFVLGSLLHAFDWAAPDGKELDMAEKFGLTVPRASPLRLVPSTRLNPQAYI
ncbi:flavonoid 3'-monooxygenase-like [Selaginella moellendorffii]|uniref:flavonoid 3'-monooxygenase-like n=1 Tax=Selaginella moellendorffii TaxID=88036 RepID=UPI000D1CB0E0|nr:flavonoid 3'-monooxygenase-like [Selaginella moellendorffii]|eukprot:XP_024533098.1 flavonoid 3'-monooxygenase-like [Selaginella moellendorffii]